jgi:hypothetical protein
MNYLFYIIIMDLPIELLIDIFKCQINKNKIIDEYLILFHIMRVSSMYKNMCIDFMKCKSLKYLNYYQGNIDRIDHDTVYWPNIYKELYYRTCHEKQFNTYSNYYIITSDRKHSIIFQTDDCDFKTVLCSVMCNSIKYTSHNVVGIDWNIWRSANDLLQLIYNIDSIKPTIGDEIVLSIKLNNCRYKQMTGINSSIYNNCTEYSYVFTSNQLDKMKDMIQELLIRQYNSCFHHTKYVDRFYGEYETFEDSWTDPLQYDYERVLQSI